MSCSKNIFKIVHNDLLPKQGCVLISEPFLQDSYFQRSVVLLVEYVDSRALGFVLNKKTDLLVNSFFPELEDMPPMPIYIGGPVCPDRLFFVHTLGDLIIPDTVQVNENLFFDGDFKLLKSYILAGNSIEGKVKFFLGYSGWDKGQLQQEITQNSWAISHTNLDIFSAEGEDYWKRSVKLLGKNYENWVKYPKDPYLN